MPEDRSRAYGISEPKALKLKKTKKMSGGRKMAKKTDEIVNAIIYGMKFS